MSAGALGSAAAGPRRSGGEAIILQLAPWAHHRMRFKHALVSLEGDIASASWLCDAEFGP